MSMLNYRQSLIHHPLLSQVKPRSAAAKPESSTRFRIQIYVPQAYRPEAIASHLLLAHQLGVKVTGVKWDNRVLQRQIDLELVGTIAQIHSGLDYLGSCHFILKGKPNPDGDGWYC